MFYYIHFILRNIYADVASSWSVVVTSCVLSGCVDDDIAAGDTSHRRLVHCRPGRRHARIHFYHSCVTCLTTAWTAPATRSPRAIQL